MPKPNPDLSGSPVIYGEVLYDCFPDDTAVLGGAPFNVAWHLQGFGLKPLFISRIGMDDRGQQIVDTMQNWGMNIRGVQRDNTKPTGTVQIQLQAGQPSFDILAEQAYDFIDSSEALASLNDANSSLLYHGSLINRTATSEENLSILKNKLSLPCFIDVNLREPWWEKNKVLNALKNTQWAKLNDIELSELTDTVVESNTVDKIAEDFRQGYGIGVLIVTLGAEGALVTGSDISVQDQPELIEDIVDSVGAGDAFSAISILGITQHWPAETILQRAMEFAAVICTIRGATTSDTELYQHYIKKWQV